MRCVGLMRKVALMAVLKCPCDHIVASLPAPLASHVRFKLAKEGVTPEDGYKTSGLVEIRAEMHACQLGCERCSSEQHMPSQGAGADYVEVMWQRSD